jgi:hypothetical protein
LSVGQDVDVDATIDMSSESLTTYLVTVDSDANVENCPDYCECPPELVQVWQVLEWGF